MKDIKSFLKKIAYCLCAFAMSFTLISCGEGGKNNVGGSNGTQTQAECKQHSFGDWITVYRPTCVLDGLKERVCTVCGKVENESTPAMHTVAEDYYQYANKHAKECLFCGTVFEEEEHEYDGRVCMTCGYEKKPGVCNPTRT